MIFFVTIFTFVALIMFLNIKRFALLHRIILISLYLAVLWGGSIYLFITDNQEIKLINYICLGITVLLTLPCLAYLFFMRKLRD